MDVEAIAGRLSQLDQERLTGWQGPTGAAYNCVSEDLCEMGLLNRDWSLSAAGLEVRAYLEKNNGSR